MPFCLHNKNLESRSQAGRTPFVLHAAYVQCMSIPRCLSLWCLTVRGKFCFVSHLFPSSGPFVRKLAYTDRGNPQIDNFPLKPGSAVACKAGTIVAAFQTASPVILGRHVQVSSAHRPASGPARLATLSLKEFLFLFIERAAALFFV